MRISIDTSQVDKRNGLIMDLLKTQIKPMLKDIASIATDSMRDNFEKSGTGFGSRWTPLKPKTIAEKRRLGYGSKPILVRTGEMKESIRPGAVTEDYAEVGSYNDPKAEYHDQGRGRLPKRQIIGITTDAKKDITGRITKSVRRALS